MTFEMTRIKQRLAVLEKQGDMVDLLRKAVFEINDNLIEVKKRLDELEQKQ